MVVIGCVHPESITAATVVDLPPFRFDHIFPYTVGFSVDLSSFGRRAFATPSPHSFFSASLILFSVVLNPDCSGVSGSVGSCIVSGAMTCSDAIYFFLLVFLFCVCPEFCVCRVLFCVQISRSVCIFPSNLLFCVILLCTLHTYSLCLLVVPYFAEIVRQL